MFRLFVENIRPGGLLGIMGQIFPTNRRKIFSPHVQGLTLDDIATLQDRRRYSRVGKQGPNTVYKNCTRFEAAQPIFLKFL